MELFSQAQKQLVLSFVADLQAIVLSFACGLMPILFFPVKSTMNLAEPRNQRSVMPAKNPTPLIAIVSNDKSESTTCLKMLSGLEAEVRIFENLLDGFDACMHRVNCCTVIDARSAIGLNDPMLTKRVRDFLTTVYLIEPNDVAASFAAARAGAVTLVEKPLDSNAMSKAVGAAIACDRELLELQSSGSRFSSHFFETLTDREKDVLNLLMNGLQNKMIAANLDQGLRTVEGDRAQVMKKLQVGSLVDLVRLVTSVEHDICHVRQEIFARIASKLAVFPD